MNTNNQILGKLFSTRTVSDNSRRTQDNNSNDYGSVDFSTFYTAFWNIYSSQLFFRYPRITDTVDPQSLEHLCEFSLAATLKGFDVIEDNIEKVAGYMNEYNQKSAA